MTNIDKMEFEADGSVKHVKMKLRGLKREIPKYSKSLQGTKELRFDPEVLKCYNHYPVQNFIGTTIRKTR